MTLPAGGEGGPGLEDTPGLQYEIDIELGLTGYESKVLINGVPLRSVYRVEVTSDVDRPTDAVLYVRPQRVRYYGKHEIHPAMASLGPDEAEAMMKWVLEPVPDANEQVLEAYRRVKNARP